MLQFAWFCLFVIVLIIVCRRSYTIDVEGNSINFSKIFAQNQPHFADYNGRKTPSFQTKLKVWKDIPNITFEIDFSSDA